MFRKLVSSLAFSPSTIESLGRYKASIKSDYSLRSFTPVLILILLITQLLSNPAPAIVQREISNSTDLHSNSSITLSHSIRNFSRTNSSPTMVAPGDTIQYSLIATNNSKQEQVDNLSFVVKDPLIYSDIIDASGGILDTSTKTLHWNSLAISPESSATQTVLLKVKSKAPLVLSKADNSNYDFTLSTNFGNRLDLKLKKPNLPLLASLTNWLPVMDASVQPIFILVLCCVGIYFFLRDKLLLKELNIILKDFSSAVSSYKQSHSTHSSLNRNHAYKAVMHHVRGGLTRSEIIMSGIFHAVMIEILADKLSRSLARPSILLGGFVFSTIGSTLYYLAYNLFEFPASGSEVAFLFIIGSIIGLIAEKIGVFRRLR